MDLSKPSGVLMYRTLLVVGFALAVSGVAWAGPQARLVVDLPGNSEPDAVIDHLKAAFGDRYDAQVADVAGALERGFGPWGVLPPAGIGPCDADPVGLEQIQAAVTEAEALMQALEYDQALEQLQALEAQLCGISEPVPAAVLARVPFLRGVIHYYAEHPAAARDAFRDAVLRQPEMEWDATYPPDPQQVFLDGVADAYRSERIALRLDAADRPETLLVNGAPVDPTVGEVELLGTDHILQFGSSDQVVTVVLHTGATEEVRLVGPGYVAAGLAMDMESPQGVAAFAVLAGAAEAAGYREVVVLAAPAAPTAWQYDDIDHTWTSVSLVLSKTLAQGRKVSSIGGVLIGAGAAVAVAGTVIGARNYTDGMALRSDMEADPGLYDHHLDEYSSFQAGSTAGYVMLGVGVGLVGAGIPLLIRGRSIQKGAVEPPKVALAPLDGGVAFGVSGGF